MRGASLSLILCFALSLASCSVLPKIYREGNPPHAGLQNELESCERIFPSGTWRLVHGIEATLAGGRKTFLIGVTKVSAADRSLHCVLLTIEGLVLFEAVDDGTLRITRAVPPFDSDTFAKGLMGDVALMLLRPKGKLEETGALKNGDAVCRYRLRTNGRMDNITDVIQDGKNRWIVNQYRGKTLCRSLTATFGGSAGSQSRALFPQRLVLTASKPGRYVLDLNLMEARSINEPHSERYVPVP